MNVNEINVKINNLSYEVKILQVVIDNKLYASEEEKARIGMYLREDECLLEVLYDIRTSMLRKHVYSDAKITVEYLANKATELLRNRIDQEHDFYVEHHRRMKTIHEKKVQLEELQQERERVEKERLILSYHRKGLHHFAVFNGPMELRSIIRIIHQTGSIFGHRL